MIVEALKPDAFAPPEPSGADSASETKNPIAIDDQSAYFTMVGVMDVYAARVHNGEAALPPSVRSTDELTCIISRTEHQRRYANYLRHGRCDEDDDRLYEMGALGAFERLVEPQVLHISWGAVSPPPINPQQIDVLRQAIADRARQTTAEAEIAGLQYLVDAFGFDKTFAQPNAQLEGAPARASRIAELAVAGATAYDIPPVTLRPAPRHERTGAWAMPVRMAMASIALSMTHALHRQPQ